MGITVESVRSTATGRQLRAEAIVPRLVGAGRGVARFNGFYCEAAEVFLQRAERLNLPEGRYAVRLCAAVEWESETRLRVTMEWSLFRRGKRLEHVHCVHRWLLPQGYLQPGVANDDESVKFSRGVLRRRRKYGNI